MISGSLRSVVSINALNPMLEATSDQICFAAPRSLAIRNDLASLFLLKHLYARQGQGWLKEDKPSGADPSGELDAFSHPILEGPLHRDLEATTKKHQQFTPRRKKAGYSGDSYFQRVAFVHCKKADGASPEQIRVPSGTSSFGCERRVAG